jgi:hypothetical protein
MYRCMDPVYTRTSEYVYRSRVYGERMIFPVATTVNGRETKQIKNTTDFI